MSRRDGNTTKVFVGSLPAEVTPDDLRNLFAPYGNIAECDIANRCGFLHLEDKELALKAIEELNNTDFMGSKISVEKGRVKPPRRRDGDGPMRGRDRGGPYSRNDGFGRGPPRNGMSGGYGGGREYGGYGDRYNDYDRGAPMRSYSSDYESLADRRPMYDDRRGYGPLNGFERRPFEDRGGYEDDRSGFEDRRLPSVLGGSYERRPLISERRPLLDQAGDRNLMGGYDRGSSGNEMYSRRGDSGPKPSSGMSGGGYSQDGGYSNTGGGGYNSNIDHYGSDGDYGSGGGYGSGYNEGRGQGGGYGGGGSGGYGGESGSYGGGSGGYGSGNGGYNSSMGGYGNSYNSNRSGGGYDSDYPQRSFASSAGGPGPRGGGDMPPGGGRRF